MQNELYYLFFEWPSFETSLSLAPFNSEYFFITLHTALEMEQSVSVSLTTYVLKFLFNAFSLPWEGFPFYLLCVPSVRSKSCLCERFRLVCVCVYCRICLPGGRGKGLPLGVLRVPAIWPSIRIRALHAAEHPPPACTKCVCSWSKSKSPVLHSLSAIEEA